MMGRRKDGRGNERLMILHAYETRAKKERHINIPLVASLSLLVHTLTCSFVQLASWKRIVLSLSTLFFLFLSHLTSPSFFLHRSLFNWNQTYFNEVTWLFSCFKASPRCRAPSLPIWLSRKLQFFKKSKATNVSHLSILSEKLSYCALVWFPKWRK